MKNLNSPAQIEGEQKNVSVLFANIPEFTVTSEKLDSREVKNTKDKLFKAFIVIVYKYGGTVNKFIDNCMLALFGAKVMHEDDPERAVYTGLDMMNAMEQFNEEHGTKLSLNVGITHGIVTVRTDSFNSVRDYKPMGDTVNCAEQLMETAKDEILVSESVYKSTSYLFEMDIHKAVSIKKNLERILPYRVVGMKGKPGRKHGVPELFYPLIGRNKEFKVMKLALNKVIKGKSAVISINGEAGVGKSRLIEEFRKVTTDKVNWMSGRCLSYGKDFPFWVFLEQIRSYIGLRAFDLESESRRKIGGKAERLYKERKDEYLPYLCVFLSIKVLEHLQEKVKYIDPESLRLQEFVSVKALFRDIVKNKPLILYFEDMQWIDPESLELLKFLLDGLKDVPIFFLFESRPEQEMGLYNIRESLQKVSKKRYKEIDLKELSINDAKGLIQSLLKIPKLPRDISTLILEKSECNPFYVVEIVRSFTESGILKQDNGSWKLTKDVSSFEIPDTIEAVIRSRIDNLPLEVKDVLGRASVIGRSFLYKILSYISEEDNLRKHLNFLEESDFIHKKNGSSSSSRISTDTEYIFRHILIRDVSYNGLLKKKRKKTHKKVAECIEDVFRERIEDLYEMLAYHYYNAGILKKSYEYYKKAGDAAKESYSNNIAIACYTKAIEIHKESFTENEKLAEFFERRGDVFEIKADYNNAIKDYENAYSYYTDTEKKAEIKRKVGDIFLRKSEYDSAITIYEEIKHMLKNTPESPILTLTLISYAFLLSDGKSNYKKAEKIIVRLIKKLDKKKEKETYARCLSIIANILFDKGDFDSSINNLQEVLTIYEELNNKMGISTITSTIGFAFYYKGELDTSLKYHKISLSISKEMGYKRGIGLSYLQIGVVYFSKGELDIALRFYKKHLEISEEINDKKGTGVAFFNIGAIFHSNGELNTALKYYERYLNISEELGYKKGISLANGNIGTIYKHKGRFNTALNYYKRFLNISEKIGNKMGVGIACCYIGETFTDTFKFDDAKEYLERSKKILMKIGNKTTLSMVYVSLSHLSIIQENYESALSFAEKAFSLAKGTGVKDKEILALRAMGKAISKGSPEKAMSYLKQSILLANKQKMQFEFAESSYELAKILKNEEKVKEAKKHLKEANKVFKKSGADGWLKKANELMNDIEKE